MPSNLLIRHLPAGILAILAILAGTLAAQVVPAAQRPPERIAPRPAAPFPPTPATPRVAPAPAVRIPSPTPRRQDESARMEALIAKALDQDTDLNIKDTPIGDAFDLLSNQTGIPIEVEPGTLSLLPYDSQTRVTATITKKPLRESLTALLRPIGLKFEVENRAVMIRPLPPLRRIAQRATWKDLGLLENLCATPWSTDFAKSLKFQFQATPSASADENRETLMRLTAKVGQGAASDVLEQATDHYGWTWYPSGGVVVVLPKTRQVERQLDRRVSVDYTHTSLEDAFLDLGERTGVPMRFEANALSSLSPFIAERFSLKANTSARQVLDVIAGQTGLSYYIEAEGVRIAANTAAPSPTTRAATDTTSDPNTQALYERLRNTVIGEIIIPGPDGSQISMWLRENDLPPDLREMLKARKGQAIEQLRRILQPTTRPQD